MRNLLFFVTLFPLYRKRMIKIPLLKMRKCCLWSAQMSQGWKCTCYLTVFPSHCQSLEVGLCSGTSQQWVRGLSRQGVSVALRSCRCSHSACLGRKQILKTWDVWATEEPESTALGSATQRHNRYCPITTGTQLILLLNRSSPKVGCNSYR